MTKESAGKEKLKLEHDIAAVRLPKHFVDDDIAGIAVVIPTGEIVQLDGTALVLDRMLEIEWNGARYGVFPDDLRKRSGKVKTAQN